MIELTLSQNEMFIFYQRKRKVMKSNILFLVMLLSASLCFAQQRCNCQVVEKKLYFHDTLCITGNDTFDYPDTPLFYDRILLENDTEYRFIAQMQTLTYMAMDEKNLRH